MIKILIADDDSDVLAVMSKRIVREGYTVITASDGGEALEKIKKESPDVILLDLMMPQMDGFEVLKNIRKNSTLKKWQPVIIISARGELENLQKGFSLEADHYLTKPCSMEDIIKGIRLMVNLIPQRKSQLEQQSEHTGNV